MLLAPGDGPGFRERILGVGSFGSGKSTSWLNIALWSQKTGSDAHFYVIDSDAAVEAMVVRSSSYAALSNISYFPAREWHEYTSATDVIVTKVRPQDWVIVDFASNAWDAVQEWYVERIYGATDMGSYFMDVRSGKVKGGLEGWKDYGVINRVYRTWMNKLIHDNAAHTFMTAPADPIRDSDDKALKQWFGPWGVRPRGQKHLAFTAHSVLLFATDGRGKWLMNTVKDRERAIMEGQELNDFALDYLVKVAGWSV